MNITTKHLINKLFRDKWENVLINSVKLKKTNMLQWIWKFGKEIDGRKVNGNIL